MIRQRFHLLLILLATLSTAAYAEDDPFPGTKSDFHGYDLYTFTHEEMQCKVVSPKEAAEGTPWIWRARFWGHEPQTDLALLAQGFHVAYVDVAGLFGNPEAVARWDAFYEYLTETHAFSPRPVLEGMSRGGLIIYNWAAANPTRVACIYADAPVCDFKSWPGGLGEGKGSPSDWRACQKAYGLSEEEAIAYRKNPIDQLKPLADAGVPLLHVCGAADDVVPVSENTTIIESRYTAMGGDITVILKEGVGHHPHSLKDPAPIVAFILKHTTD